MQYNNGFENKAGAANNIHTHEGGTHEQVFPYSLLTRYQTTTQTNF